MLSVFVQTLMLAEDEQLYDLIIGFTQLVRGRASKFAVSKSSSVKYQTTEHLTRLMECPNGILPDEL